MDGRFSAFSFVDRITSLQPGVSINGHYAIPAAMDDFPSSLVAEAVGQLAAWAAMDVVGFSHRPVAGIAGTIQLLSVPVPGQRLDLAAELESVDTDTVGYTGTACINGRPVLQMLNCVGPMVPLEEFDDPDALRERFHILRTTGASSGGFHGLPILTLERGACEPGQLTRATLQVPSSALFFADHFPRRPVFPGTLLMHANLQLAAQLAVEVTSPNSAPWRPRTVSDVKLRDFILPGQMLTLEARRTGCSGHILTVAVETRISQRLIGSAGIQFSSEATS